MCMISPHIAITLQFLYLLITTYMFLLPSQWFNYFFFFTKITSKGTASGPQVIFTISLLFIKRYLLLPSLVFSVSSEALSRLDELHRNRYQSKCHSSSLSEADVHSDVDNSSVVSEPAYFPVSQRKYYEISFLYIKVFSFTFHFYSFFLRTINPLLSII